MTLRADAAVVGITPRPGLFMAGYAARHLPATGTLDPLEANLLLLADDKGARTLLVSLDVLAVTSPLKEAMTRAVALASGTPPDAVRLVASHTHAAPIAWTGQIHPVLPGHPSEAEIQRITALVAECAARLQPEPCVLDWAIGEISGAGTNRHAPDGPHERSSGVLHVRRAGGPLRGSTVALLYDYACHPTTLGPGNLMWSSDWVGAARARLRASRGRVPVLFLPGASGDVSTRFVRAGRAQDEMVRVGSQVAIDVERALGNARPITGVLVLAHDTIRVPTRRPPAGLPMSPDREAASRLEESLSEGVAAARAILEAGLPESLDLPVSWMSIGPARWLFTSVEPFATFGVELARGDRPVRVVGYTDCYHGYMPDAAAYEAQHYEAGAALVDAATAAEFYGACTRLCRQWAGSGAR